MNINSTPLNRCLAHRLLCVFALLVLLSPCAALAQEWVTGRVTDARTGETVPMAHVYYNDAKRNGVVADNDGNYRIAFRNGRTLVFEAMGYEQASVITNRPGTRNIRLNDTSLGMSEVVVERKRTKYRRKNNPAVEMMRKVIAAKNVSDIEREPYYTYRMYEKQTLSVNEFLAKSQPNLLDSMARMMSEATGQAPVRKHPKAFDFLKKYAERCGQTGKTILPVMVEEKVKERVHRLAPRSDKTYVLAQRSTGLNDLLTVGGELNTLLADVFQDVNIYHDDVRLFQRHFMSPIADGATGFYRYFIEDTVMAATACDTLQRKCYRLTFTPNNPQDFGFSGELLVLADSSWQVHSCEINVPSRSGVNFVDELCVRQAFATLPDGRRVLAENDMLVQMSLLDFLAKMQVQRTTRRTDFSFEPVADARFKPLANEVLTPDAELHGDDYWLQERPMALTTGETRIDSMVRDIERVRGYKVVRFFLKAYGEDFVETSRNSVFDIGSIRKLATYNSLEGFRLRLGGQTTARLHPHIYLSGYAAYGFRDRKWKGMGEVSYSFNRKKYRPHEFPTHALSLSYAYDMMSAADRKLAENRNDLFSSIAAGGSDHRMYQAALKLTYTREWANGLMLKAQATHERLTPCGLLFFQPLGGTAEPSADPSRNLSHFDNTELKVTLRYQPGNTYVNSKKRRHETHKDAPIYQISHTVSPKGLWGNRYMSNITEFELYRRVWLSSWGRMDFTLRGAWQWNKVPFPLLNTPDANLSFIMMRRRFCLMNDMEFLNDRNLSLHWKWDLAGKIFNRIPLLRRLKLRETIGCNVLWGQLSDRNNPAASGYADRTLWHMPGQWRDGKWQQYSYALDHRHPYVEVYAGIFNILRFFNVTYVHRLTHNDHPDTSNWGFRFGMEFAF